MKTEYVDGENFYKKIRNLQILLGFCMNEIIKQIKVECVERSHLLKIIWANTVDIFMSLEIKLQEIEIISNENVNEEKANYEKEYEALKAKYDAMIKEHKKKNELNQIEKEKLIDQSEYYEQKYKVNFKRIKPIE